MLFSLYAVLTAFYAVIFSLYAVLFLLCAVANSLYAVLFSLCTESHYTRCHFLSRPFPVIRGAFFIMCGGFFIIRGAFFIILTGPNRVGTWATISGPPYQTPTYNLRPRPTISDPNVPYQAPFISLRFDCFMCRIYLFYLIDVSTVVPSSTVRQ